MTSNKIPLSVQLWSVRDDVKADMAGSLAKIGKMGFDGVEFAGYGDHKATDIAKYLKDAGLKASGCHIGIDAFDDAKFSQTVDFHKAAGISWLIIPWLDGKLRDSADACKSTAEKLTQLVGKLSAVGMKTGFHLHDADVKPLSDGKSAWQHLAALTPKDFIMQFDTGNALQGGADPVQGLRDLSGRALSLHLKEFPMDGSPIGSGSIAWKDIFAAAQSGGTHWYVAECEVYTKHKPMDLIEASAKWLRSQGV
jgi:sugar phosphate isomerase/epimerase